MDKTIEFTSRIRTMEDMKAEVGHKEYVKKLLITKGHVKSDSYNAINHIMYSSVSPHDKYILNGAGFNFADVRKKDKDLKSGGRIKVPLTKRIP